MNHRELEQILIDHADGLNQRIDTTEQILKRYRPQNPQQYQELKGLLKIANQLKLLLVPVYGREQFVARLEHQLLSQESTIREPAVHPAQTDDMEAQKRPWLWWSVAATGSLIAGAAGFFFWRRLRPNERVISTV